MEENLSELEGYGSMDGPVYEDLVFDETLSDVDRIVTYTQSTIPLQRLVHVKMIADVAEEVGYDIACSKLLPILAHLAEDSEYVVRQHLVSQMPPLCEFLVKAEPEKGYQTVINTIIPVVTNLLTDHTTDVRSAASDAIIVIAGLVTKDDLGQHILTAILSMAHEEEQEILRISAITMLGRLAENLGKDLCHQFVVPEIISLSEDPLFRVRKFTVMNYSNVCKISGLEYSTQRLLPQFLKLTKDTIWGVRKACAENLAAISGALDDENWKRELIKVLDEFLDDDSKYVRTAAGLNYGQFLASLPKEMISQEMVSKFVQMGSATTEDSAIRYHCAFNFPAVVFTLGADRWEEVSGVFHSLCKDTLDPVRRTLSCSLHEIAKVIGTEKAERDLRPAFSAFLCDSHVVKMGAILTFVKFLMALEESSRADYIPHLREFFDATDDLNWRIRQLVAEQLPDLSNIYTIEWTVEAVAPLALCLASDDVATVAETSVKAFPALLERLDSQSSVPIDAFINEIKKLAKSDNYKNRQICFALVAGGKETREVFEKYFEALAFELAGDKVTNVMLVLSRLLASLPDDERTNEKYVDVITKLRSREDPDIRSLLDGFPAAGSTNDIPK